MEKKVVVENNLTPYIDFLKDSGYDVYTLYKNKNLEKINSPEYSAIVVSGIDVLSTSGANYENPQVPIIEAKGKTPEEIYDLLENKYNNLK
ncbi:YkuS family protein [Anaerosalibacter massiliensis]|uniref:YkuS family protein n=1 Tax=Anaerosalibacter massiliensis TaxID=1347392 RepID=A0A9X2MHF3_9FIRM|nr:YkuS family protein [Anaerosalibacter massiliensis]MCR2045232.1 YkuS family protein [Anaerosalibacter massiliensis]